MDIFVNWQVKYALQNLASNEKLTAQHVDGDLIRIAAENQPDVLAAILPHDLIEMAAAVNYVERFPELDFLCGYRSTCIWHGQAIGYLHEKRVGWGSFGTLVSAALDGNAKFASHKQFKFADRLLRQHLGGQQVDREFDRVYRVSPKSGVAFRLGMMPDYEPTADAVRSLCERFGRLDFAWNINPNGRPTLEAVEAGRELGCGVVGWSELKLLIK